MKGKLFIIDELIVANMQIRKQVKDYSKIEPGKTLNVSRKKKRWQYYVVEDGKRKCMSKSQTSLIKNLEAKFYFKRLTKATELNIKALSRVSKILKTCRNPFEVFKSIPEQKRHLIKPYQYQSSKIKELREEYGPGSFFDNHALSSDYYGTRNRSTKSGYLVRSKSEEDIADAAWERGLFFIYEKDLVLQTPGGPVAVHPDFAFYNAFTDRFIYLEHLGKVDDPEYASKSLPRLLDYIANGFVIGQNLFLTSEGAGRNFTKREIKKVLDKIEEQLFL
ncbi:MAG: hypothetical protein K6F82_04865 [Sphaerochaetaceae bacterium]|nr:hypothetical protein [Sphaerochaetaceae bacterium]